MTLPEEAYTDCSFELGIQPRIQTWGTSKLVNFRWSFTHLIHNLTYKFRDLVKDNEADEFFLPSLEKAVQIVFMWE